jgi:hemoglobin-like flavoprotein
MEVMESFNRVRHKGLAEKFYETLLGADPRIKVMFKNTNFERQRELFVHGVLMLIEYANGKALGEMAIKRLGELHSRRKMNVPPDLYPIWVNCLVETLAKLDPKFSPTLERQWREILQKGIDVMIRVY